MADFCTKCTIELFGEEVFPEIDVEQIISELRPDTYMDVLCEGCGMATIGKSANGEAYIALIYGEPIDEKNRWIKWITLDEYEQLKTNQ